MFPNPYNFPHQAYQLGYNPWTVHAQAQFRAAQAQLQQSQLAAYNVQPTLIQQAQSAAALQQIQQQQALTIQAALIKQQQQQQQHHQQQQPQPQPQPQHQQQRHHHHHQQQHQNQHQHQHQKYKFQHHKYKKHIHAHHSHSHNNNKANGNNLFPKTCTICNVVCNSSLQWTMHINGKKHTKQIRGVQYQNTINNASTSNTCTSISSISTSTAHNSSLDNNNTNNKLKENNMSHNNNNTNNTMIPSDQYVVEIDGRRKCALCHVEFTSAMCEMSHIKGKRHQMATRGHPQHYLSKKRKNPSVTLGRCELCDVDFTSQTQKDSHLTGKKHCKNVRLVDAGQPPKKRQKTNYFSSFNKKSIQPPPTINARINNYLNGVNGFVSASGNDNTNANANGNTLKPHEKLQMEVERIYKEYTQIAKNNNPLQAQQIYQRYQLTYDDYIREYNLFAANFKKEQKPIKKEAKTTIEIIKQEGEREEGEQEQEQEQEDYDENEDIDLKRSISNERDESNELMPTITTISTVKEENNHEINDDDD